MCLEEIILWGYLIILSNYKYILFCFGVFFMFVFFFVFFRNLIVFKMVLIKFKIEVVIEYLFSIF